MTEMMKRILGTKCCTDENFPRQVKFIQGMQKQSVFFKLSDALKTWCVCQSQKINKGCTYMLLLSLNKELDVYSTKFRLLYR